MSNQTIIRKVTGLKLDFANSALRNPRAFIQLSCGHTCGQIATIGNLRSCGDCGTEFRDSVEYRNWNGQGPVPSSACPNCGCTAYRIVSIANPHKPEERGTVPVACRCEQCETEESELARIPEYVRQSVHSRYREWCGGIITFYKQDPTSPTGVIALATITATPRAEALIRKCNSSISPLSPTEGLSRGTGNY